MMGLQARLGAAMLLCSIVLMGAAPVISAVPSALALLRPGLWEIAAENQAVRRVCVADARAFVQIEHRGVACTRMPIASDTHQATVHYSCPGAGWGRTIVHADSPQSARIDTQGIAADAPFAYQVRATRVGDCTALARR